MQTNHPERAALPVKAVQQIMLGPVCTNEEKALHALRRIKAAGFDALELNDFMTRPSPMIVRFLTKAAGMPTGACGKLDWPALLDAAALAVSGLHTNLGGLEAAPETAYAEAARFRTDRLIITGMYRFDYGSEANVRALARRLNEAGRRAAEHGLRLFYHNHNAELLRTDSAEHAYSILLRETDARYVNFEFDSYWFADAGADPLDWMRTLGPRMQLWHINDRGTRRVKMPATPILKSDSLELGTGNLPLPSLLAQALENGTACIVLESHRNWVGNDSLASIERSAEWLNQNLSGKGEAAR